MGALGADTAVRPVDEGAFAAMLSPDWEIWGPNGGYVASVLLRTEVVRRTRSADAVRVSMVQGERPIAEGLAWVADADLPGFSHQSEPAIPAPGPDELIPAADRVRGEGGPSFPFWENLDQRPMDWVERWPPPEPLPARTRQWFRFTPDLAEPRNRYLDACRSLIVIDTMGWPAAGRHHVDDPPRFIASGQSQLLCRPIPPT